MTYVRELPEEKQNELLEVVKNRLIEEGYSEVEIHCALKDARNSKVSDLEV